MFQLRNPVNAAASTHAGVLEFIADEGIVYLPHWMMRTLKLVEGERIRVTGAQLPKGKFVKLQAQETSFLEVSDPKAVLEQALRNWTCLTQGDTIEISYNSLVFGLLVMETRTMSQNNRAGEWQACGREDEVAQISSDSFADNVPQLPARQHPTCHRASLCSTLTSRLISQPQRATSSPPDHLQSPLKQWRADWVSSRRLERPDPSRLLVVASRHQLSQDLVVALALPYLLQLERRVASKRSKDVERR